MIILKGENKNRTIIEHQSSMSKMMKISRRKEEKLIKTNKLLRQNERQIRVRVDFTRHESYRDLFIYLSIYIPFSK